MAKPRTARNKPANLLRGVKPKALPGGVGKATRQQYRSLKNMGPSLNEKRAMKLMGSPEPGERRIAKMMKDPNSEINRARINVIVGPEDLARELRRIAKGKRVGFLTRPAKKKK